MSAASCCRPPVTSSDSAGPALVKCQSLVHDTCLSQAMDRTLYLNLKREGYSKSAVQNKWTWPPEQTAFGLEQLQNTDGTLGATAIPTIL